MENWAAALSELETTVTKFLDSSTSLRDSAFGSVPPSRRPFGLTEIIARVEEKRERITWAQKQLGRARRLLNELLNTSASRVPMHRLPPELLRQIFAFSVASTRCPSEELKYEPLLTISSVCVAWRSIALGTPSLWSHIDIDFYRKSVNTQAWLDDVAIKLQRSRGALIHIHVPGSLRFDFTPPGPSAVSSLVSILRAHTLSISSVWAETLTQAEVVEEILSLSTLDGVRIPLRSLVADGSRFGFTLIRWPPDLSSQLVELKIAGLWDSGVPSMWDLWSMLGSVPFLRSLWLERSDFHFDLGHPIPKISLPNLQLLILHLDSGTLSTLVASLHPGELTMDIRLDGAIYTRLDSLIEPLQGLLSRCNVTALTIPASETDSRAAMSCLAITPHVQALFLNAQMDNVSVLSLMLMIWLKSNPAENLAHLRVLGFNCGIVHTGFAKLSLDLLSVRNIRHICLVQTAITPAFWPTMAHQTLGSENSTQSHLLSQIRWLKVFVDDPTDIYDGRDMFIQKLIADS